MKLFTAEQIRQWDQFTIQHEPVASIDLMERAAAACTAWILSNYNYQQSFYIFCGNGNNGGDGLAIAGMLHAANFKVAVYILKSTKRSKDCEINLQRLIAKDIAVNEITEAKDFPIISKNSILIDALFGTGLNKPLQGIIADLINHINFSGATIISIDMPSGLYADQSSKNNFIIKAHNTLSFQCYKKAFMMAENEPFTGDICILDIGLNREYNNDTETALSVVDRKMIESIYKPRNKFSHKYSFGHVLLFAGSTNMMGAAILSAAACLRSGAGLVTVHTTPDTQHIIQTALPEAIASTENNFEKISQKKAAIGIGPGLQINEENSALLNKIIGQWNGPFVIDASGLHLLNPFVDLLKERKINPAIITPHAGEFEKLFGKTANDFEQLDLALSKAAELNCYIVLKGHHTLIACPDGKGFFNNTGNSGMATAGSGDVLTGIITGLLAQGYNQNEACILGVYLHGFAGDIAAAKFSQEAMIAGDITANLGDAYLALKKNSTP